MKVHGRREEEMGDEREKVYKEKKLSRCERSCNEWTEGWRVKRCQGRRERDEEKGQGGGIVGGRRKRCSERGVRRRAVVGGK